MCYYKLKNIINMKLEIAKNKRLTEYYKKQRGYLKKHDDIINVYNNIQIV